MRTIVFAATVWIGISSAQLAWTGTSVAPNWDALLGNYEWTLKDGSVGAAEFTKTSFTLPTLKKDVNLYCFNGASIARNEFCFFEMSANKSLYMYLPFNWNSPDPETGEPMEIGASIEHDLNDPHSCAFSPVTSISADTIVMDICGDGSPVSEIKIIDDKTVELIGYDRLANSFKIQKVFSARLVRK